MNKLTVKGIVMTIIVFLSTALAAGFPSSKIQWAILGITLVGTMAGYIAQSALFPSVSVQGSFDVKDLVKSLLISIGNVLSTIGATVAITSWEAIDWTEIGKSVTLLFVGYVLKQMATPAPKSL